MSSLWVRAAVWLLQKFQLDLEWAWMARTSAGSVAALLRGFGRIIPMLRPLVVVLCSLLAWPPILHAAEMPLSLRDAQRSAVERSRQLAAQDSAVSASREMAVASGQLPDPALKFGIDNLPINSSDRFSVTRDFMTMRRIGVMQEFTREEKRRLRSARFDREADRALAEKDLALAAIQRDTAVAWLDVFYLERLRAAFAEQDREARLEIEAAESAYRGGRGSQADVLNAQSARVMIEDRLSELDRRIRNARATLARWAGETARTAPLAGEPAVDSVPVHAHELEQQLERHPNIAAMTQEIAMMEAEAALARANKRSDWTWEVAYQQRGPEFSNMVSVGVAIPLQWDQKNRQDRELAAKLATAEKARAQRDEALRQHVAEVQSMLNEWENGRERLGRYQRELMPLARDRTQAVVSAYRGGKGDLMAVLAARRNEIDVRTQSLQLQMDTARVWAQLRYLYPDEAVSPAALSTTKANDLGRRP
jgi:outer membrane protein TolC